MPVVVLVNKGSASAAEIVSGALHDEKRAKLVGETTFGKGTVQTPFDLSGGAAVHITTGKWLLPSGNSISQKGITPDYVVTIPAGATATQDTQLVKAIELLLQ
jgi:carboxyl-terminal processing protease